MSTNGGYELKKMNDEKKMTDTWKIIINTRKIRLRPTRLCRMSPRKFEVKKKVGRTSENIFGMADGCWKTCA